MFLFQFLIGAMRLGAKLELLDKAMFQFLIGAMRLETDFIKLPVASTFQFLIGAMRR